MKSNSAEYDDILEYRIKDALLQSHLLRPKEFGGGAQYINWEELGMKDATHAGGNKFEGWTYRDEETTKQPVLGYDGVFRDGEADITFGVEIITPTMAKDILGGNTKNRKNQYLTSHSSGHRYEPMNLR